MQVQHNQVPSLAFTVKGEMSCTDGDLPGKEGKEWPYHAFTNYYFMFLLGTQEGHLFPLSPATWILAKEMWTGNATCPVETQSLKPPAEATRYQTFHEDLESPGEARASPWKGPGYLLERGQYFQSPNHTEPWEERKRKLCKSLTLWSLHNSIFFRFLINTGSHPDSRVYLPWSQGNHTRCSFGWMQLWKIWCLWPFGDQGLSIALANFITVQFTAAYCSVLICLDWSMGKDIISDKLGLPTSPAQRAVTCGASLLGGVL